VDCSFERESAFNIRATVICLSGNKGDCENESPHEQWNKAFGLLFNSLLQFANGGTKNDSLFTLIVPHEDFSGAPSGSALYAEKSIRALRRGKWRKSLIFGYGTNLSDLHDELTRALVDYNKTNQQENTDTLMASSSAPGLNNEQKGRSFFKISMKRLKRALLKRSAEPVKTIWFDDPCKPADH